MAKVCAILHPIRSGVVRAYDAASGQRRRSWDPIPHEPGCVGAANAWAPMAANAAPRRGVCRDVQPEPDFYGRLRPGHNRHANSRVALRASTGASAEQFAAVNPGRSITTSTS